MHNGGIAEFSRIKRKLQERISDEIFEIVQGNTGESCVRGRTGTLTLKLDSEWVFALYLSLVGF
jgi:predicted glutamine amidotransferase